MPIPVPPADRQITPQRLGHQRLLDEPDLVATEYDYEKQEDKDGLDDSTLPQAKNSYGDSYVVDEPRRGGVRSLPRRVMAFLVKHGVESRGIEPVPETVRKADDDMSSC
jgi:hypothetical protein